MWQKLIEHFRNYLHQPRKIFYFSVAVVSFTLVADGTLWNLWRLRQERSRLSFSIEHAREQSQILEVQIAKAKDPNFLKKQARDRLDLLAEDEIVFIFPKGE